VTIVDVYSIAMVFMTEMTRQMTILTGIILRSYDNIICVVTAVQ